MQMENTLTIEVDDGKTQRLLRRILHQQEEIFKVLDSFDELSDIIETVKTNTQQIQGIVPNSEE
jgi:hypothetical protein